MCVLCCGGVTAPGFMSVFCVVASALLLCCALCRHCSCRIHWWCLCGVPVRWGCRRCLSWRWYVLFRWCVLPGVCSPHVTRRNFWYCVGVLLAGYLGLAATCGILVHETCIAGNPLVSTKQRQWLGLKRVIRHLRPMSTPTSGKVALAHKVATSKYFEWAIALVLVGHAAWLAFGSDQVLSALPPPPLPVSRAHQEVLHLSCRRILCFQPRCPAPPITVFPFFRHRCSRSRPAPALSRLSEPRLHGSAKGL